MRLWKNSYARTVVAVSSAALALSVCVHTGLIALWIIETLPGAGSPPDAIANRPIFLPPPDRAPSSGIAAPTIRYITLSKIALPTPGEGARTIGNAQPLAIQAGTGPTDTAAAPAPPPQSPPSHDSVYSILDVDTAVVRTANSAAPAYPLALLQAHITGYVQARYVVDTTGFADTTSFTVVKSTNPGFIVAVREALPYMRFTPAKIGSLKVRQLVEQQFSFRITDTTSAASAASARRKKPNGQ